MELNTKIDHHLIAVQQEATVHAMLELRAPEAPSQEGRTPLSLVVVVIPLAAPSRARLVS